MSPQTFWVTLHTFCCCFGFWSIVDPTKPDRSPSLFVSHLEFSKQRHLLPFPTFKFSCTLLFIICTSILHLLFYSNQNFPLSPICFSSWSLQITSPSSVPNFLSFLVLYYTSILHLLFIQTKNLTNLPLSRAASYTYSVTSVRVHRLFFSFRSATEQGARFHYMITDSFIRFDEPVVLCTRWCRVGSRRRLPKNCFHP